MDDIKVENTNKEESLEKDSSLVIAEQSSRLNQSEFSSCVQLLHEHSHSECELGKRKLSIDQSDISGNIVKKRKISDNDDDSSVDSKGNIRGLIDYDGDDEFINDIKNSRPPKRAAAIKANDTIKNIIENSKKRITPEFVKPLSEDEYNFDDYETDDDYDDDDEDDGKKQKIIINISNLLKGDEVGEVEEIDIENESDDVKKFFELITKPSGENNISNQIEEFKNLSEDNKKNILNGLEIKQTSSNEISMMCNIMNMTLPIGIKTMILNKHIAIQHMDKGNSEYYKQRSWVENVCSVPFGIYKDIPVKIEDGFEKCGEFIEKARQYLDAAIYGQDEAKFQIIQFIGNKIINPDARGLSLLLIGPPGIGKTSLIKNGIAKALGWPFQFISLGGDSDSSTYTGHQLVYEGSHYGKIIGSVIAAKSLSMVLMFDELDKISRTAKGEEIQNMLIHLTDPVQNGDFEDKYMAGIPIDLGKTMFIFSGNDITKIDRILLDRMVVIQLDGYDMTQKLQIVEKYIIPETLKETRLENQVIFTTDTLTYIIKEYANKEAGVRELRRCIESIVQKINILRMYNNKVLPYYIEEFKLPFTLKKEYIDLFLKKKEGKVDEPPLGMYI